MTELQQTIEKAWEIRDLLKDANTIRAIRQVINLLDEGKLRVAQPTENGWQVNEWIKKAVVLYFPRKWKLLMQVLWSFMIKFL